MGRIKCLRIRQLRTLHEARRALKKMGAHWQGVNIMAPKAIFKCIEIKGLTPLEATFLKQGILSKGGECALPMETFKGEATEVTALLMGTHYQLAEVCKKLRRQPFALKKIPQELDRALKGFSGSGHLLLKNGKKMQMGKKTRIMGIVNVTPDSFSDGGKFYDTKLAIEQGLLQVHQGADIIDIGGESTRPFAEPVSIDQEIARVIPVIKGIAGKVKIPISIDTYRPEVAKKAIRAGVTIVNDVFGLRSEGLAHVCAREKVPVVIMHMQGEPRNMQKDPKYADVVGEVFEFLKERSEVALEAGIRPERIVIDPGIGFGKTMQHNLLLMKNLAELRSLGYPVLLGPSRKSFIGHITKLPVDQRLNGTLGAVCACALNGADIIRVHDVLEARQALDIVDAIKGVKGE